MTATAQVRRDHSKPTFEQLVAGVRERIGEGQVWEGRHRAAYMFMRSWNEEECGPEDRRVLNERMWNGEARFAYDDLWGASEAAKAAQALHTHAGYLLDDLEGRGWR